MQSWVANKITISKADIFPKFIDEDGDFDFNRIIPMPEDLDMDDGGFVSQSIVYYVSKGFKIPFENTNLKEFLIHPFDDDYAKHCYYHLNANIHEMSDLERHILYKSGEQYLLNMERYGHYTWFTWRKDNWGSKWNASCTIYRKECPNDIYFDTATWAPIPIFEKLCEMFPDEQIEFYSEYDDGTVVEYVNKNGELRLTRRYEVERNNNNEN